MDSQLRKAKEKELRELEDKKKEFDSQVSYHWSLACDADHQVGKLESSGEFNKEVSEKILQATTKYDEKAAPAAAAIQRKIDALKKELKMTEEKEKEIARIAETKSSTHF